MTLTLHKLTKININMSRFIERILYSYRLKKSPQNMSIYNEIYYAVLKITHKDIRGYDNSLYIMQALMKKAYIYATENNYSQADIDILNGIMDLL